MTQQPAAKYTTTDGREVTFSVSGWTVEFYVQQEPGSPFHSMLFIASVDRFPTKASIEQVLAAIAKNNGKCPEGI